MPLSDAVRTKTWEDAKGSFNDPALISPPVVEFSLYKKVPSARKRADTRQGTIDQDPEFMAFLAGLANPTQPKDVEAEHDAADKAQTKVTTTPLVEYLKEKKASRARESSSKKGAKDSGSGSKTKGASKDDASSKKKGRGSGKDDKSEKSKEPVKILTKKAAAAASEQTADGSAKNGASGQTNAANSADGGKSRRAGIAAAARILQRDLGLSPGSAHRRARQDAAKADTKAGGAKDGTETTTVSADGDRAASPAPSDAATSQASKANTSKTSGRRNRGGKNSDKAKSGESAAAPTNPPVILKKRQPDSAENSKASAEETNGAQSKGGQASKAAQNNNKSGNKKQGVSPDATRAFVKNVSTSQGVTEATLRQALEMYGDVTSIEVDKRKGFAYVDFTNNEGLSKAISASPVAIGQTSVQVLERKDKSSGGGNNNGNKQQAAANGEANGSAPSGKPEKSGRGRRGRGGGNKNADKGGGDKAQPANGGGG